MLDGFTLDTNIVKLRSDVWSAMKVTLDASYSAGDFIIPYSTAAICGVITADTTSGDDAIIVYKAEKIVVPCSFSTDMEAGTAIAIDAVNKEAVAITDGNATAACGILTEDATSYDTECEITLNGNLLPIDILT